MVVDARAGSVFVAVDEDEEETELDDPEDESCLLLVDPSFTFSGEGVVDPDGVGRDGAMMAVLSVG